MCEGANRGRWPLGSDEGSLEWGEFVAVAAREDVPEGEELSEVTLRQVFESIDTDGEASHRSQSGASSLCDHFSTHDRP